MEERVRKFPELSSLLRLEIAALFEDLGYKRSMRRFHFLDAMRGLTALFVVCGHYWGGYPYPPGTVANLLGTGPLHFWLDGFAAVSFFFVLSGFVLSHAALTSRDKTVRTFRDWLGYWLARVFRLHPALFAAMAFSALVLPWQSVSLATDPASTDWLRSFWSGGISAKDFLIESSLVTYRPNPLIPQAWTLSLEFWISLFVPFGALLAGYSLPLFVAAMAVGLARLEFQGFLFHFSLGILLAAVYHHDGVVRVFKSRLFLFLAFAVGFLLYASRFLGLGLAEKWIWPLTGLGSALLILCALYSEVWQRVLTKAPLVSLGRISYSLYLLHFAVLLVATPRALAALNHLGITGAPAWIFGLFGTVVCSLALAYLSERWIEVPFIRIGKRLRAYWRI